MKTKEFAFSGMYMNGFGMLFLDLITYSATIWLLVMGIIAADAEVDTLCWPWFVGSVVMALCAILGSCGFVKLEPNEARVMMFFGKYVGTFTKVGYYWVNPFVEAKKLSLRARNLDPEPIKVNDKTGNPILIGIVVVWKLKDTYKAMFEIDAQTMASNTGQIGSDTKSLMAAFEKFVHIQSDAALRQVAGRYAYDDTDDKADSLTLRDGGDVINNELKSELEERLAMAGIEIVEARVNYLAYAPEIAAVMLRRQQATAIITAREKIVEGAVSMVKMALDKLKADNVVELDDDKKAAMVSNLMVVLCGEDSAQPVVNTGTLNH